MQSKLQNLNLTYKCLLELNLYLFKKMRIKTGEILALKRVRVDILPNQPDGNFEVLTNYYFLSKYTSLSSYLII
mgnify:CR=1 FL=1